MDDLIGQSFYGYEIREKIGAGGFGIVYKAFDTETKRDIVVKAILPERLGDDEVLQRFELEAQIVSQLEHPHIIPMYDYWISEGRSFLAMEYLTGGNLRDSLNRGDKWTLARTTTLLEQILGALGVAHQADIIHRDLKPENILFDNHGKAYLGDFGLAKRLNSLQAITGPDGIIGSPAYLSPEQLMNQKVSARTDIYSIGVLLYEILAAEHPFADANGQLQIMMRQIQTPLPQIHLLNEDIPKPVNQVIQIATAKDPADRYPNVATFLASFKAAAGLELTPAETAELPQFTDAEVSNEETEDIKRTTVMPRAWNFGDDTEVTQEANPTDLPDDTPEETQ